MIGNVDINVFGGRIGGTSNSNRRLLSSDNSQSSNNLNSPSKRSFHNPNKRFDKTVSRRNSLSTNEKCSVDDNDECQITVGKGKDEQPHHLLLRTQIHQFEKKSDRDDVSGGKFSNQSPINKFTNSNRCTSPTQATQGPRRVVSCGATDSDSTTNRSARTSPRRQGLSLSKVSDHNDNDRLTDSLSSPVKKMSFKTPSQRKLNLQQQLNDNNSSNHSTSSTNSCCTNSITSQNDPIVGVSSKGNNYTNTFSSSNNTPKRFNGTSTSKAPATSASNSLKEKMKRFENIGHNKLSSSSSLSSSSAFSQKSPQRRSIVRDEEESGNGCSTPSVIHERLSGLANKELPFASYHNNNCRMSGSNKSTPTGEATAQSGVQPQDATAPTATTTTTITTTTTTTTKKIKKKKKKDGTIVVVDVQTDVAEEKETVVEEKPEEVVTTEKSVPIPESPKSQTKNISARAANAVSLFLKQKSESKLDLGSSNHDRIITDNTNEKVLTTSVPTTRLQPIPLSQRASSCSANSTAPIVFDRTNLCRQRSLLASPVSNLTPPPVSSTTFPTCSDNKKDGGTSSSNRSFVPPSNIRKSIGDLNRPALFSTAKPRSTIDKSSPMDDDQKKDDKEPPAISKSNNTASGFSRRSSIGSNLNFSTTGKDGSDVLKKAEKMSRRGSTTSSVFAIDSDYNFQDDESTKRQASTSKEPSWKTRASSPILSKELVTQGISDESKPFLATSVLLHGPDIIDSNSTSDRKVSSTALHFGKTLRKDTSISTLGSKSTIESASSRNELVKSDIPSDQNNPIKLRHISPAKKKAYDQLCTPQVAAKAAIVPDKNSRDIVLDGTASRKKLVIPSGQCKESPFGPKKQIPEIILDGSPRHTSRFSNKGIEPKEVVSPSPSLRTNQELTTPPTSSHHESSKSLLIGSNDRQTEMDNFRHNISRSSCHETPCENASPVLKPSSTTDRTKSDHPLKINFVKESDTGKHADEQTIPTKLINLCKEDVSTQSQNDISILSPSIQKYSYEGDDEFWNTDVTIYSDKKDPPNLSRLEVFENASILSTIDDGSPVTGQRRPAVARSLSVSLHSHSDIERSAAEWTKKKKRKGKKDKRKTITSIKKPSLPPLEKKEISVPAVKDLKLHKILGEGSFGQVWLASFEDTRRQDDITDEKKKKQKTYALKILSKFNLIQNSEVEALRNEINVLKKVQNQHPCIMNLIAATQDENLIYLMQEFAQGGELFTLLHKIRDGTTGIGGLPEAQACFYAACLADALCFLHTKHLLVFRDLKPENVMLNKYGYPVIIDFGYAKFLDGTDPKTYTLVGTPRYMSPELILSLGYDFSTDNWSLGVLIYELLSGYNPFEGPLPDDADGLDETDFFSIVVEEDFAPLPETSNLSNEAQGIVAGLLTKEPSFRLGFEDTGVILEHSWFKKHQIDFHGLRRRRTEAPWIPEIDDPLDTRHFDDWDHLASNQDTCIIKQSYPKLTDREALRFAGFDS